MPKIRQKYTQDMPKICLGYVQYMPKICQKYAQDMPKICLGYFCDMPTICQRYAKDMPKISPRYALDMPKICPIYPKDMPRYAKDMSNIWEVSCGTEEAEAQKPSWHRGNAIRKVFARPESFCA